MTRSTAAADRRYSQYLHHSQGHDGDAGLSVEQWDAWLADLDACDARIRDVHVRGVRAGSRDMWGRTS